MIVITKTCVNEEECLNIEKIHLFNKLQTSFDWKHTCACLSNKDNEIDQLCINIEHKSRGRIQGYLKLTLDRMYKTRSHRAHIITLEQLYVFPQYRNRKIATQLMNVLVKNIPLYYSLELYYEPFSLFNTEDETPDLSDIQLKAFYQKFGFKSKNQGKISRRLYIKN